MVYVCGGGVGDGSPVGSNTRESRDTTGLTKERNSETKLYKKGTSTVLTLDVYDAGCPGSSPANQRALPGTDAATSAQCRWSPALLLQVHVAPCPTACGKPVRSRGEDPLALAQGCMPSSEVMSTSRLK